MYILHANTNHRSEKRLSLTWQQNTSKESTYICRLNKKGKMTTTFQTAFVQHWQLLMLQTRFLVGHRGFEQQNVLKEATSRFCLGQFGCVSGNEPRELGVIATRSYQSDCFPHQIYQNHHLLYGKAKAKDLFVCCLFRFKSLIFSQRAKVNAKILYVLCEKLNMVLNVPDRRQSQTSFHSQQDSTKDFPRQPVVESSTETNKNCSSHSPLQPHLRGNSVKKILYINDLFLI